MRSLMVVSTMVFGYGALCSGVVANPVEDEANEEDEEVEEGEDAETSCCQYTRGDQDRFDLMDGPSACDEAHGDEEGHWVTDARCAPCCCKTVGRPELVTDGMCEADEGKCVKDNMCKDGGGERGGGRRKKKPDAKPSPKPVPSRPRPKVK